MPRLLLWGIVFSFVIYPAAADTSLESAWMLSEKEIKRVQSGKIVAKIKSQEGQEHVKKVNVFLMVHAPATEILTLITDYKKLPEFMPNLKYTEVLKQDKKGALVNYILDLPFGVTKRYRLQLDYDTTTPDLRLTWRLVPWEGLKSEETIRHTSGYWLLEPVLGSTSTLLTYYTNTDPGDVPFGLGWIVDYLTEKTVIDLLKQTKIRAERQWKAKKDTQR